VYVVGYDARNQVGWLVHTELSSRDQVAEVLYQYYIQVLVVFMSIQAVVALLVLVLVLLGWHGSAGGWLSSHK
jgi:hypothetical protein